LIVDSRQSLVVSWQWRVDWHYAVLSVQRIQLYQGGFFSSWKLEIGISIHPPAGDLLDDRASRRSRHINQINRINLFNSPWNIPI